MRIVLVDDERFSLKWMEKMVSQLGSSYEVVGSFINGSEALTYCLANPVDVLLTDIRMPVMDGLELIRVLKKKKSSIHPVVISAYDEFDYAREAMKLGAFGYFVKSHNPDELLMEIAKAISSLEMENMKTIREDTPVKYLLHSKNPQMQQVWNLVDLVADSGANVLITGESGTGKEIIAEEIHRRSRRSGKPFIAMNCQQYPHDLLESELFGHEKGAYTGAVSRRIGKLEQAAGGTIFLDEIGDISPKMQVGLLRVLQEKEIERVGGTGCRKVDVRIVAATNRDLRQMVREGSFREDLYFRLSVYRLTLPPLREHSVDLDTLVRYFIRKKAEEYRQDAVPFPSRDEMRKLYAYSWPGNVRELSHIIEKTVVLTNGKEIQVSDLPKIVFDYSPGSMQTMPREENGVYAGKTLHEALDEVERKIVIEAYEMYGTSVKVAEVLGVSQPTAYRLIKKHCML